MFQSRISTMRWNTDVDDVLPTITVELLMMVPNM